MLEQPVQSAPAAVCGTPLGAPFLSWASSAHISSPPTHQRLRLLERVRVTLTHTLTATRAEQDPSTPSGPGSDVVAVCCWVFRSWQLPVVLVGLPAGGPDLEAVVSRPRVLASRENDVFYRVSFGSPGLDLGMCEFSTFHTKRYGKTSAHAELAGVPPRTIHTLALCPLINTGYCEWDNVLYPYGLGPHRDHQSYNPTHQPHGERDDDILPEGTQGICVFIAEPTIASLCQCLYRCNAREYGAK